MSDSTELADLLAKLSRETYCYLTTKGRVTGKPHEIEIWFGASDDSVYLLSGGGTDSDWVKNLIADPAVSVRIAKQQFSGVASLVAMGSEETMARRLLASKYYHWREGRPLNEWASTALPVAIKLSVK